MILETQKIFLTIYIQMATDSFPLVIGNKASILTVSIE